MAASSYVPLSPGPELEDRLDPEAATEAFLEHEFDRMRSWQRLRESELEEWRTRPANVHQVFLTPDGAKFSIATAAAAASAMSTASSSSSNWAPRFSVR
jgi:hypothetical protein